MQTLPDESWTPHPAKGLDVTVSDCLITPFLSLRTFSVSPFSKDKKCMPDSPQSGLHLLPPMISECWRDSSYSGKAPLNSGSSYCSFVTLKKSLYLKKMWYLYTMEYYSAIKRNEIMPFVPTWMDQEIVTLSEVSQTEKDKYHTISLICGI